MRRWFLALTAFTFTTVIVCIGVLGWLLTTSSGAQWLADQVTDRFEEVSLHQVSGNLVDGLMIGKLSIHAAPTHFEAHETQVKADLWALLFDSRLDLAHLRIRTLLVESTSTEASDPVSPQLSLPEPPLEINISELQIAEANIMGEQLLGFVAALSIATDRLTIDIESLNAVATDLSGHLEIPVGAQPSIVGDIKWQRSNAKGHLTATGLLHALQVEHQFEGPVTVLSRGSVNASEVQSLRARLQHELPKYELSLINEITMTGTDILIVGSGSYQQYKSDYSVVVSGDTITASRVSIIDDTNKVAATGTLNLADNSVVLDGEFHVEDYTVLVSGIEGLSKGTFELRGNPDNPEISANFTTEEILVSGVRLKHLQGSASYSVDLVTIKASADSVAYAGESFSDLMISTSGTLEHSAVRLQWSGGNLDGQLGWSDGGLSAHVNSNAMITYVGSNWRNDAPIDIRIGGETWKITPHCWQGIGKLCITSVTYTGGREGSISGYLSQLPIQAVPVEALNFTPTGQIDGSWEFTYSDEWLGTAAFSISGMTASNMEQEMIILPAVTGNLRLSGTEWGVDIAVAQDKLVLTGELAANGFTAATALSGFVRMTDEDLALVREFEPGFEKLSGLYTIEIDLSGTLADPQYKLVAMLERGSVAWDQPAMKFDDVTALINATNNRWSATATGRQGDQGGLTLQAGGTTLDFDGSAKANIAGAGFLVDSPEVRLRLVPDLSLDYSQGKINLGGIIEVPEATIELASAPKTLRKPSFDVTVLGRAAPKKASSRTLTVDGRVTVELGNAVRYSGLGLDVGITGNLVADIENTELTALRGELVISGGKLEAEGQSLTVESGRLLYTGAVDRPYLELIAVRQIEDQTPPLKVGLRVRGTIDNLESSVYSNRVISDTSALSYLVLGRDFESEGADTDNSRLLAAAFNLGLKKSAPVFDQLSNALGMDELSALALGQSEFAIVAGKRISKDLYVRYTYNALSAVGAFVIRYSLSKRVRLEATSSENSSMDILYKFTR